MTGWSYTVEHSGLGLAVKTRHFRRRNSCSHRRKAGSKNFEGSQEIVEFSVVCSHLRGSSTLACVSFLQGASGGVSERAEVLCNATVFKSRTLALS